MWGRQIIQNSSGKFVHSWTIWKEGKLCNFRVGRTGSNLGTRKREGLYHSSLHYTRVLTFLPLEGGERFWITQSESPTGQLLSAMWWTFYWVAVSTKLVTLQTVQSQQPQAWEPAFMFLLLCKLHPQSIHPSLPTKSPATALSNPQHLTFVS